MRRLNTAQKIILIIGLIVLAIRCFTYEPVFLYGREGWSQGFNDTIAFHCLGIISVTSVLMLIAGVFGGRLKPYLADKRKLFLWVGIPASALVVIGALTWGVHYYLESRPNPRTTSSYVRIAPSSTNTTKPVIQPSEIELFDAKLYIGTFSSYVSGRVKNHSSMNIHEINLRILIYDSARKYIDTNTVTISFYSYDLLAPGEVRSFRENIYFSASPPENWSWNYKIISVK